MRVQQPWLQQPLGIYKKLSRPKAVALSTGKNMQKPGCPPPSWQPTNSWQPSITPISADQPPSPPSSGFWRHQALWQDSQRREGRQCMCVVTSMRVCSALILYDRPMALLKWGRSREHKHPDLCWVETQETRALPIKLKLVHCLTGSKLSCDWMWYMTSVIALGS